MFKLKFVIDEEAIFVYWLQSIIDWTWFNFTGLINDYSKMLGNFTDREMEVLGLYKGFLQQENKGYIWLWDRYVGNEIKSRDDQYLWDYVHSVFQPKVEILLEKELPKFQAWKEILDNYDFTRYNDLFERVKNFYGVKVLASSINVKLLISLSKVLSSAHVKREYPDHIILNISSLDKKYINNAIKSILHEAIHQIDYKSDKDNLMKISYEKIIKPQNVVQKKPSWKHLFVESIVTSIVTGNNNRNYFTYLYDSEKFNLEIKDIKEGKLSSSREIQIAAKKILDTTIEYLDKNKEMDSKYTDKVARCRLDLKTNSNVN